MDLRQIQYFLHLAETLNFTHAAAKSDVSQPALTRAIQRLEEELGGPLVYRDGKDTRLTELGRTIRSEFEAIVESEMRARTLASKIVNEEHIMMAVGVANSLGPDFISRFLDSFLKQEQAIEIIIQSVNPEIAPELVLSGALDVCFSIDPAMDHEKLQVTPLFRERLMIASTADHPFAKLDVIPVQALGDERYLDRMHCEFRRQVHDFFMDHDVLMRPQWRSDREDWVQSAVAAGAGLAIIPEFSRTRDDLCLTPIENMDIGRNAGLISISGSATAPAVRRLRKAAARHPWPLSKL